MASEAPCYDDKSITAEDHIPLIQLNVCAPPLAPESVASPPLPPPKQIQLDPEASFRTLYVLGSRGGLVPTLEGWG